MSRRIFFLPVLLTALVACETTPVDAERLAFSSQEDFERNRYRGGNEWCSPSTGLGQDAADSCDLAGHCANDDDGEPIYCQPGSVGNVEGTPFYVCYCPGWYNRLTTE